MHRKCYRPIKVFVTTPNGYQTYLVENNDVFEATENFVKRFRGIGYKEKTIKVTSKSMACFMVNKDHDAVLISSFRLYWPNAK